MKIQHAIDPVAAFPDEKVEPLDDDLAFALGSAYPAVGEILRTLTADHPEVTGAWQYSNRSGWYRVALLKKRRIFYLVPKHGDFSLLFLLGGRAIASLDTTPHAKTMTRLLKTAKRWPEGTELRFNARSCDPALVRTLIAAKIAH